MNEIWLFWLLSLAAFLGDTVNYWIGAYIGKMTYWRFISYNIFGGFLWVGSFVFAGFYFGNIPLVKNNFSPVIFAIIIISVMPAVIEYLRQRKQKSQ